MAAPQAGEKPAGTKMSVDFARARSIVVPARQAGLVPVAAPHRRTIAKGLTMTNDTQATRVRQRRARPHTTPAISTDATLLQTRPLSRLDQLQALLLEEQGTTLAAMAAATGWQPHSVRGAMAGALRKRGLVITSLKQEGPRRYHAEPSA